MSQPEQSWTGFELPEEHILQQVNAAMGDKHV